MTDNNKPETLEELTGHDSGIVIYNDSDVIVCNWANVCTGEYQLPKSFILEWGLIGWPEDEYIFEDAEVVESEDVRKEIPSHISFCFDDNDDLGEMMMSHNPVKGRVYYLKNGVVVISPDDWN